MEFTSQLTEWISWIVDKVNGVLLFIAEMIAEKTSFQSNDIFLALLAAVSLYASYRITDDRGLKLLLIAIIIFAVFFNAGGL